MIEVVVRDEHELDRPEARETREVLGMDGPGVDDDDAR